MRKLWMCVIGTLLCAAVASPAYAQEDVQTGKTHISIGYQSLSVSGGSSTGEVTTASVPDYRFNQVFARAGYDFTRYLGIETEAIIGVGEATENITISSGVSGISIPIELQMEYALALLAKAQYPVFDDVSVHVRFGGIHASFEGSISSLSISNSESDEGFAYGIGSEIGIGDGYGIRLDWTRMDIFDDTADGVSIGLVVRF